MNTKVASRSLRPYSGAMFTTDLPYAGYPRVSANAAERQATDDLHSDQQQYRAIDAFAERASLTIERFPAELDVSGAKAQRKVLDEIIRRVRAGDLAGVVVARLDRLSRLPPKDRIDLFDQIEGAGGRVLSATEPNDTETPEGWFTRELFLNLAHMQWRRYRDGWATSKADALARGVHVGNTPFGFCKGDDGILVACPVEAPIVEEAFRIAIEKGAAGLADILAMLHEKAPVRVNSTKKPRQSAKRSKLAGERRTWTMKMVRTMLANRSYLGEVSYGDLTPNPGAHKPLVTRSEFLAAQRALAGKRSRQPIGAFPLSNGPLLCNGCGDALIGSRSGSPGAKKRSYRCGRDGSRRDAEGNVLRCPEPTSINADNLEAYLLEWLREEYPKRTACPVVGEAEQELRAAEAELADAEEELGLFVGDALMRKRLGHRYQPALEARLTRVEELEAQVGELAQRTAASNRVEVDWDTADAHVVADLLRRLGARVVVRRLGRGVREIAPRVAILLDDEPAPVAAA